MLDQVLRVLNNVSCYYAWQKMTIVTRKKMTASQKQHRQLVTLDQNLPATSSLGQKLEVCFRKCLEWLGRPCFYMHWMLYLMLERKPLKLCLWLCLLGGRKRFGGYIGFLIKCLRWQVLHMPVRCSLKYWISRYYNRCLEFGWISIYILLYEGYITGNINNWVLYKTVQIILAAIKV